MAKIFKNAVISSETINLCSQELVSEKFSEPDEDSTNSLVSNAQLKSIQQDFFEQGYIKGKKEATDLIEQEIEQLKNELKQMIDSIPKAIAKNRLELNTEIADIVLAITQQFFIEKEANPQALVLQINQLLTQLNDKQTIELYLHPREIEILKKGMITLDAAHLTHLKIKSDEHLSLGGFVIKTNHGVFNAGIEQQIDKLKAFLLETRQRGQHAALV